MEAAMALSTEKQIEELNELIRLDLDAVSAYTEAIHALHDPSLRDPLTLYRGDHERHVTELSVLVQRLGGKPAGTPDVKGVVRKTMTKIAGLIGEETILKAMKSNEEATNKAYSRHAALDFPVDILDLIRRNYDDEKKHLQWVEQALSTRLWERPGTHP
jgi:uncharacterized protein (TIGR02284 family)